VLPDDKLVQLMIGLSGLIASSILVVGHRFGLRRAWARGKSLTKESYAQTRFSFVLVLALLALPCRPAPPICWPPSRRAARSRWPWKARIRRLTTRRKNGELAGYVDVARCWARSWA
jgi:hypothetical protein